MTEDEFSRATFVAAIGARFAASPGDGDGDGDVALVLYRVEDREAAPGNEAYAVYFRGPVDKVLAQQTVRLDGPEMATMTVFLVPVAQVGDRIEYEACFHHLAPQPVDVERPRETS